MADYAIETGVVSAPSDLEIEREASGCRVRVTWASVPPTADDYKIEVTSDDALIETDADIRREFDAWQNAASKELIDG